MKISWFPLRWKFRYIFFATTDALNKSLSFQLHILGYRLICKDPGAGKSLSSGSQQFYRWQDYTAGLAAAAAQGQTANVATVAARPLTGGLVACETAARYGECYTLMLFTHFIGPNRGYISLTEFSSAFKMNDVFAAFRIRDVPIRIRILLRFFSGFQDTNKFLLLLSVGT
jgi:hypothetical protein